MLSEHPAESWSCDAIPTPAWKRAVDLSVAIPLLVLMLPVMAVVALITRLTMGGPILFRQDRGGHGGTVFQLLKFRTMLDLHDDAGKPLPDADRRHWWGSIVRRFSLDELPSLIHVLRGEMSLVGPRPFLATYLERYSPEQARRHAVVPGITGLAQTRGRNFISWDEKFALDLYYVDHHSFRLDMQIVVDTFKVVLTGSGADGAVHATEFMGNDATGSATEPAYIPEVIPEPPRWPEPIQEPGLLSEAVTTLELATSTLDLKPQVLPRYEAS